MRHKTENFIGWIGVVAIVAAYLMVSFKIIEPSNIYYQLMNLAGSICIITEATTKKDYQPIVINVFWGIIAIIAIGIIIFS